ncbi:MAG: hypothetical protein AMXMBFR53_30250 [Gemmatimonadota bacterium]
MSKDVRVVRASRYGRELYEGYEGHPWLAFRWPDDPSPPISPEEYVRLNRDGPDQVSVGGVPNLQRGIWWASVVSDNGDVYETYLASLTHVPEEGERCEHGDGDSYVGPHGWFIRCDICGTILSDRRKKGERRKGERRAGQWIYGAGRRKPFGFTTNVVVKYERRQSPGRREGER